MLSPSAGVDLPMHRAYHPLGHRAEVTINSPDVLEGAGESGGSYGAEFDWEPLSLRIVVEPEGEHAEEPSFRQQGHLLSNCFRPRQFFGRRPRNPYPGAASSRARPPPFMLSFAGSSWNRWCKAA